MDDILDRNGPYGEGEESDFKYILDSDVFHSVPLSEQLEDVHNDNWFSTLFDDPMLCDKDFGAPSPTPDIQAEHSYSLSSLSEPGSPVSSGFDEDDLDTFDLPLMNPDTNLPIVIKSEPLEDSLDDPIDDFMDDPYCILTEPLPKVVYPTPRDVVAPMEGADIMPMATIKPRQGVIKIKLEPMMLDLRQDNTLNGLDSLLLPPTPPSSTTSDSDGGNTPPRRPTEPDSPKPAAMFIKKHELHARMISTQPIFTNTQRLPQSGPLILTEEEKRTLTIEGYPIPNKLPLTKAEEKSLKKVRRKIKNKISAQESRRKKKEYVEALERKMETYTQENLDLKRKLQSMESTNRTLATQLQKLQSIVNKVTKPLKANSTQSGTCLMVLVLCFAVFLGGWSPHSLFGNSNLPTMPSTPRPHYGPLPSSYYARMHYNSNQFKEARMGGLSNAINNAQEQSQSAYYDPFITPSMRSSRMLYSSDENEADLKLPKDYPYMERMNPLDASFPPALDHNTPVSHKLAVPCLPHDNPAANSIAGAFLNTHGSNVISQTVALAGLQAVMHPDIEAQLVALDSVTKLTNNSKNK